MTVIRTTSLIDPENDDNYENIVYTNIYWYGIIEDCLEMPIDDKKKKLDSL